MLLAHFLHVHCSSLIIEKIPLLEEKYNNDDNYIIIFLDSDFKLHKENNDNRLRFLLPTCI